MRSNSLQFLVVIYKINIVVKTTRKIKKNQLQLIFLNKKNHRQRWW